MKVAKKELVLWALMFLVIAGLFVVQSMGGLGSGHSHDFQGREAPAFAARDASGKVVDLQALRGKTVVLNFYATWCPPCREEIPDFARFHVRNQELGRDVEMYGVVFESGDIKKAAEDSARMGTNYPILDGTGPLGERFHIHSFPTTFVIAPDGSVAHHKVGLMTFGELERAVGKYAKATKTKAQANAPQNNAPIPEPAEPLCEDPDCEDPTPHVGASCEDPSCDL